MNARDKELVKQAELMRKYNYAYSKELQEFVSLIRADEREACAELCDEHNARQSLSSEERYAAYWLAQTIRARGNK